MKQNISTHQRNFIQNNFLEYDSDDSDYSEINKKKDKHKPNYTAKFNYNNDIELNEEDNNIKSSSIPFPSILTNPIHQKSNETKLEEKQQILNALYAEIRAEINKVVICTLCKRKFANKAHYIRHCTFSELHKKNEKKEISK